VNRKEITGSTVRNYIKSIKLFYEMTNISISWKKITHNREKIGRHRIPTIEKIEEYPDRRIKA
jgi:hypothetical protein